MKGASKVIMGATLVMVVSLAFVLALILVLLAELYCSLLLRRRKAHLKDSATNTPAAAAAASATAPTNATTSFPPEDDQHHQSTSPLSSFYAQGVLHAPRNFLFPALLSCKEKKLHQVRDVYAPEPYTTSPSPSTSFATSPNPVEEISIQVASTTTTGCNKGKASGHGAENLVYISNPIYDNGETSRADTPFETPGTSPSRLENSGTSGDDDDDDIEKAQASDVVIRLYSPPLSPMKKLPAQACSVSLRDATSLGTSDSDSNCNNCPSSSSSASLCISPSW
ncbi:hypothetical protein PTKIN_Ptkin03bG0249700 [Pterospermum kingtungense]